MKEPATKADISGTKADISRMEAAMDRMVRDVTRNFAFMMVAFVIFVTLMVWGMLKMKGT